MEIQESIAQAAMQMKNIEIGTKIQTKLMAKVMDTFEDSAEGVIKMMNETASFPGDSGSVLDVMA